MVAVAYDEKRWSFTRSSNYRALTDKVLVFWINGRLLEVVAYKRWSHREVRLYYYITIPFSHTKKKTLRGKDNNHFRFILD